MSAYIVKDPATFSTWLVDGESKFLVSDEMLDLIARESGADKLQAENHALKDRIAELVHENAKLRELISEPLKCDSCEAMLDCDECLRADVSHKRVRSLEAENAKLRELATLMYTYHHGDCYSCKWHDECCNELVEWKCIASERIDEMACELGIEVDRWLHGTDP